MPRPLQLVKAASDQIPRGKIIDEFGELDRLVQMHKPIAARHEKLRKEILGWFSEIEASADASVSGDLYQLMVSPRERQRHVINMAAVCKAFGGLKEFLKSCSITIKALEEKLGDNAAKFLEWRDTGPRKLTPILKESPAAPAKAA